MRTSTALRAARLLTVTVAASLFPVQAMAQTNNFVVEAPIQAIPLDLEVTPNGRVAVVRGNNPNFPGASNQKVSFWRTDNGAQFQPPGAAAVGQGSLQWVAASGKPLFGDALAVTNSAAIAIGSAAVGTAYENTTYVDILALSYPPPTNAPQVAIQRIHTLGGGTDPERIAGEAHDVAITPDGTLAVVSHRNWIHVFDMASGDLITEINIGALGAAGGPPDPCSPASSRNSLAVTNTRAVVTAARADNSAPPNNKVHTWVYVVDLGSTSDPHILLEHRLDPSGAIQDQYPHDLAITPDGQLAVVTTDAAVGLYGLGTTPAYLGGHYATGELRRWSQAPDLWDSVEVSDTHAVVLSNVLVSGSPRWSARVFAIGSGGLLPSGVALTGDPAKSALTAWDVALSGDGKVAAIKTWNHDVALLDVPGTGVGSAFIAGPGYPYSAFSGHYFGNDATTILAPSGYDPSVRWGAFVGKDPSQPKAWVQFYDLDATDPGATAYGIELNDPSNPLWAADIERSANGAEVMVRLSASDLDSGTSNGEDWSRFAGTQPSKVVPTLGALGVYAGADTLRVSRNKSVSISRDPDPFVNAGWIHIVTVQ